MISLRNSGNTIADEFYRLTNDTQTLEKKAQDLSGSESFIADDTIDAAADAVVDAADTTEFADADDAVVDFAADGGGEALDPESFLVDQDEANDDQAANALDGEVNALDSFAGNNVFNDKAGNYIMSGLGKIAASLRGKGEGFAADMVEATALSISGDLAKVANEKASVTNSLNKLAVEFDNEGDTFAGDMVRATINNIING